MLTDGQRTNHASFLFPDFGRPYPVLVRGEGNYVYDADGKKYLDGAGGGVAVVSIGHGVRPILDALSRQAEQLAYFSVAHFANRPVLDLAERLVDFAPPGMAAVYFLSAGTEAIEYALKIARLVHLANGNPGKTRIISRWQGYHGSSLAALSLSGRIARRRPFRPMLFDTGHIEPSYCYRCPFGRTYGQCALECAEDLEKAILREGAENVAAFIAEPIVGATAGAVSPPVEYFPIIREICDRYDVLFIADEVMTGCGRTGKNFGIDHWNVTPDLIAVGKGLSSGYAPLAACILHERVAGVLRHKLGKGLIGPTHGGNPVSCAVGLAVLRYLEEHRLIERCAEMGDRLLRKLDTLRVCRLVGDVRGKGLLVGIELVAERETKRPFNGDLRVAEQIGAAALERGVSVYPGSGTADGMMGDHILLAPPFTISDDELDLLVNVLAESMTTVEHKLQAGGQL